MNKFDICIIGGGAAGLMAAAQVGKDVRVAVLEKNTATGRKLMLTGGCRCNLTNMLSPRDFLDKLRPYNRFLQHCIYEFSAFDTVEFFREIGLNTVVEPDGCVFPQSQRAADVKDVLYQKGLSMGCVFLHDKPAEAVAGSQNAFTVDYRGGQLTAKKLIIATGGLSYPKTGSTGDGYRLAENFGHTIKEPQSCLVPLVCSQQWVGELAGVAIERAAFSVDGEKKKQRIYGAMVFTADGVGGPAVLNFSRKILPMLKNEGRADIFIDLLPDLNEEQLINLFNGLCEQTPRRDITGLFTGLLPRSLIIRLASAAMIAPDTKAGSMSRKARFEMAALIKKLPLTIIAAKPIEQATVTRGGVNTDEIDPKTMQSKICPNLFFAGEVMDVDGPCGGYNLQIAFSTAVQAAKNAQSILNT